MPDLTRREELERGRAHEEAAQESSRLDNEFTATSCTVTDLLGTPDEATINSRSRQDNTSRMPIFNP